MKRVHILAAALIALSVASLASAEQIRATLSGYEEPPSVSTGGSGEFRAIINRDDGSIDYEMNFSGLQGTVQQSHIHVGQMGVNGSVVIWLCQTDTTQAPVAVRALTPFCPQSGTVRGHITAANVVAGATTQQLAAGDLDSILTAIRAGFAYVNIHTTPSPGGEIRGQIRISQR